MSDIPLEAGRGVPQVDYGNDIGVFNRNAGEALDNQGKALDLRSKGMTVDDQSKLFNANTDAGNPQQGAVISDAAAKMHMDYGAQLAPQLDSIEALPEGSPERASAWKEAVDGAVKAGVLPADMGAKLSAMPPSADLVKEAKAIAQHLIDPKTYAKGTGQLTAGEQATANRDVVKGAAAITAGGNFVRLDGNDLTQADGAAVYRFNAGMPPAPGDEKLLNNIKDAKSTDDTPLEGTAPPKKPDQGGGILGAVGRLFNGSPADAATGQPAAPAPASAPIPAPAAPAAATTPPTVARAVAAPRGPVPPGYENAPTPKTQAEYNALPKGAKFFMVKNGKTVPAVK